MIKSNGKSEKIERICSLIEIRMMLFVVCVGWALCSLYRIDVFVCIDKVVTKQNVNHTNK